jgi:hypothetical protein
VQLVRGLGLRAGFLADARDGVVVEGSEVRRRLRVEPAPARHRLRPSLLEGRVVEKGVRPRAHDLERERGRLGQIANEDANLAALDLPEQVLEGRLVHRLLEAIEDRLSHERMVGDLPVAREVLRARELVRENERARRSSARTRWIGAGTLRPPEARGWRARGPAFQRHRAPNIGASSSAPG